MSLDILNDNSTVDLTTVRTAAPILKAGLYQGTLTKCAIEPNKKATGSNMNIEVTLSSPAETVDGKTVSPGFKLYDTVSLVRTFKDDGTTVSYDPVNRLVELIEALTGEKSGSMTPRQMVELVQSCISRSVAFRTKVEQSAEYGDKTRIQRYVKLA